MKRDWRAALVGVGLALSGCAGPDHPEAEVVLSGRVVDEAGRPAPGVQVGYYKKGLFASDCAVVSDAAGRWSFAIRRAFLEPPPGRVFFRGPDGRGLSMHRADELPDPVVFQTPPEPEPEPEAPGR